MFVQLTQEFLGHVPGKRIDVSQEHAALLIEKSVAQAVEGDPLAPVIDRTVEELTARVWKQVNTALTQFAYAQSQSLRR